MNNTHREETKRNHIRAQLKEAEQSLEAKGYSDKSVHDIWKEAKQRYESDRKAENVNLNSELHASIARDIQDAENGRTYTTAAIKQTLRLADK